MNKWHITQNQPLLREIFKEPPILTVIKEGLNFRNQMTQSWKSTFGFPFSSTIPALIRSQKLSPVRRGFKVEYPVLLAFFLYLKQYLYRSIQFSIAFSASVFPRLKNLGRSGSLADLDTITADVLHSKSQIFFQKNSFQTVFILTFYDLLRTRKSFWVL